MKKRITSTDVAREAGVSRATVSYILNNVKSVSIKEETRERVLATANKLEYHPDSMAQALKTNKSMSIGVVSKRKISEQRFIDVLSGIKDEFTKNKYSITLCSEEVNDRGIPEYYSFYKTKKIDGIIFLSYQEGIDKEELDKTINIVKKERIPVVFADYHIYNSKINCVDINYFHGAYIAVKHLIEKGYKEITLLIPDTGSEQEKQRLKGVKKAIEEAENITLEVVKIGLNGKTDKNKIIDVLKQSNKHTALIGAWQQIAFKTLYEANKNRINVPNNIGIISLAGSEFSNYSYPKMTTCDLPLYELGKKSAEILFQILNKSINIPVNMLLPCTLSVRESC